MVDSARSRAAAGAAASTWRGAPRAALRDCGLAARRPRRSEESCDFVEGPLRSREPDPLERGGAGRANRFQALEREREMGAALGRDERVDLVDDHRVDGAKHFACVRRQEQVQRLGRRDQNVRRIALEPGALDRGRVPRPDGDRRRVVDIAAGAGTVGDAGERGAQVPLDIDGQRLERRHVQHAAPPIPVGRLIEHEPVDAPQERGQRLAAAGRRQDQRGLSPRNCRPSLRLRWRGPGEGVPEPFRHRRMKQAEHAGRGSHTFILLRYCARR